MLGKAYKLKIEPVKKESLDCLESIVATVASNLKRESIFMFANSWGFSFTARGSDTGSLLGDRIGTGKKQVSWNMLQKYAGIKFYWSNDKSNILDVLYEELENGRPLLLKIDAFNCPWYYSYKAFSFSHYCLVIGFDTNSGSILCIDPYTSDNIEYLYLNDFMQGLIQYAVVKTEYLSTDTIDLHEIVNQSLVSLKNNPFEQIEKFAEEFTKSFDLQTEKKGYEDLQSVPLLRRLKELQNCRINFAELLNYLFDKSNNPVLLELLNDFREASSLWNNIRMIILKMMIVNKEYIKRELITDKLYEVMKTEMNLEKKLHSSLNNC